MNMKSFLLLLFIIPSFIYAQSDKGFRFGAITYADLEMKTYAQDTAAEAVVLNEFGSTWINDSDGNLVLDYHIRIKILKRKGFKLADYKIPLHINDDRKEIITEIQASTFNLENNKITESKVDQKNIFSENTNKYRDYKKFALPNVRIGSIIEIHYVLESPFIYKWRTWEFQDDIPKVYSEFWARIPANYIYNTTLRGYLKLSKNESEVVQDCFTPGGGNKADCALYKFAMKDIPAFHDEPYMTAQSNFISYIDYELLEIRFFNGRVEKYTEEWKDVDKKLQTNDEFGDQIKQARKLWDDNVKLLIANSTDMLNNAHVIFDAVKNYYLWDDVYGEYTEFGVKKAYQDKKGNVGDINLSLIGALQAAGIDAEPALISTRENGLPVMLHPVMSGFNYVIARITVGQEHYWLDATHRLHPFGFVPEECLNGKVRIIGKNSDWVDLKPKDKDKLITESNLDLATDGSLKGTMKLTHSGYDAFGQRKKYFSHSSAEAYYKAQAKNWHNFDVLSYTNQNADSLEKNFVEKYEIEFSDAMNAGTVYFSPFLVGLFENNPFRSTERNFPVDFGAPLEQITLLTLHLPANYVVDELPKNVALALPQGGGRFLFSTVVSNDKIQMTCSLTLNKTEYSSNEYHYLRELFARVIQAQESQIVLKKKN